MAKERPKRVVYGQKIAAHPGGRSGREVQAKELSWEEGQGPAEEQRYPYMAALPAARGDVNSESRFFRVRNDLRRALR